MGSTDYAAIPMTDPDEALDNANATSPFRKWVEEVFVEGDRFQSLMAVIILGNAAVIGLETDVKQLGWLWDILEDSFLLVFVIELGIRLYALRTRIFKGPEWASNLFDASLVISGMVDYFVTEILKGDMGNFGIFMKSCRLLRIMRLFRLFKMIKPLYMLASGFLESSSAVFWVSVLCFLGLYICAVFLTRTLGLNDSDPIYAAKFGSVGFSMFTLFELMANPDLEKFQDIMLASPGMMLFFVIFIIYGSFAMLSILTGVISEGMIEKGNSHKEEMRFEEERKKSHFLLKLRRHFEMSDTDGDGTMDREEFSAKIPELIAMFKEHSFFYAEEDLQMVFDLVDFDKGGTVEVDEFLHGMISFTGNVNDLPMQFLRMQSNLMVHLNKMQDVFVSKFTQLEEAQRSMDAKLNVLTLKASGPYQRHGICC